MNLRQSWRLWSPKLYWFPTVIVLTQYFYTIKLITGRSMQPTLNPDSSLWRDVGLFDRLSIRTLHRRARGDVVALRSPEDPNVMLVKRILALEGDVVKTLPPYPDPEVRIPQGHIWVEGDESFHSDDSNRFGPVPLGLVDSKMVFILWPLQRWGFLRPPSPATNTGPAWRRSMDDIERDMRRRSRVTPSTGSER